MKILWVKDKMNCQVISDVVGVPIKRVIEGLIRVGGTDKDPEFIDGIEIELEVEPTPEQLEKFDLKLPTMKRVGGVIAHAHLAKVVNFQTSNEKPLVVSRIWKRQERTVSCYVTEQLKDLYLAGTLVVGDFVTVDFIEGDIDKPLAMVKVYKSW